MRETEMITKLLGLQVDWVWFIGDSKTRKLGWRISKEEKLSYLDDVMDWCDFIKWKELHSYGSVVRVCVLMGYGWTTKSFVSKKGVVHENKCVFNGDW